MHIDCERLVNGGRLDWSADEDRRASTNALRILVGFGRGCVLYGQALAATIVIPLRGRVQLSDGEQVRTLVNGELLVCESGQRVQAIGRGAALWIAVFAESGVWHQLTGDVPESAPDPLLVPAVHMADRASRRAAVRLARIALAADRKDTALTLTAAFAFAALISDLQAEFDPIIARCPGRTLAQRRGVFLRLQRVRQLHGVELSISISSVAGFARVANYSTCHFVRTFSPSSARRRTRC